NCETDRLGQLDTIINRADPGPGGFYGDLGDPERQPHLVRGAGAAADPAFYATPLPGFAFRGTGPDRTVPNAWWTHAESLYDEPLQMRYTGLDRGAAYRVRVVYGRERAGLKIRLAAQNNVTIHDYLSRPLEPVEFDVP